MLMTIQYQNGLRFEAVLLAASGDRMRVVVKSRNETIELYSVNASWFTPTGVPIQIESLVPLAGTEVSDFCAAVYPRAYAAGGTVCSFA